jgi:hypothetical protein
MIKTDELLDKIILLFKFMLDILKIDVLFSISTLVSYYRQYFMTRLIFL